MPLFALAPALALALHMIAIKLNLLEIAAHSTADHDALGAAVDLLPRPLSRRQTGRVQSAAYHLLRRRATRPSRRHPPHRSIEQVRLASPRRSVYIDIVCEREREQQYERQHLKLFDSNVYTVYGYKVHCRLKVQVR